MIPELCSFCKLANMDTCKLCKQNKRFISNDDVKDYFRIIYTGTSDDYPYEYRLDNTNPMLKSTQHIRIRNRFGTYFYYCPYCGENMHLIQKPKTLEHVGYYCICEGARAELEYNEKRTELENKHKEELRQLESEYKERLTFDIKSLCDAKMNEEQKRIDYLYNNCTGFSNTNHFSKNGNKPYEDIEELL